MQDTSEGIHPVPKYPGYYVHEAGYIIGPKGPLKASQNSRGYHQVSLTYGPPGGT